MPLSWEKQSTHKLHHSTLIVTYTIPVSHNPSAYIYYSNITGQQKHAGLHGINRRVHDIRLCCRNLDLADRGTEKDAFHFHFQVLLGKTQVWICAWNHGTTPWKQERPLLMRQELIKLWEIKIIVLQGEERLSHGETCNKHRYTAGYGLVGSKHAQEASK